MNIIVINSGSSSIKYQIFEMPEKRVIAKGLIEKIGLEGSRIKHTKPDGEKVEIYKNIPDHQSGIKILIDLLTDKTIGCFKKISEVDAVGHRVVHGGEKFSGSVRINEDVVAALEECVDLAPLHNPPNLEGIYAVTELLPEIPQVGVFDTAFHQSMPSYVFLYGLPYELYQKYGVRRYGFHGTSHRYVSKEACSILDMDYHNSKVITCHLGNGASIAAVKNGKSLDTSMGMTPNEGLIMGTRSGDLDSGVLLFIADKMGLSIAETSNLLNKKSGMLGVSGISSDMRDIEEAAEKGDKMAILAMEIYAYRIKKYIGAFAASMGGVDAIVFTGGIGENDIETRKRVLTDMEFLGIDFDEPGNQVKGKFATISKPGSKVSVLVVPTDEEMVIAEDTYAIICT